MSPVERIDALIKARDFAFAYEPLKKVARHRKLRGTAVTLGEQPNQIDLLTSMSSVPTGEILDRAVNTRIGEVEVKVVSYEDLISAKKEAGRPEDKIDIDELKKQNEDN